jgi:hypothetical protein
MHTHPDVGTAWVRRPLIGSDEACLHMGRQLEMCKHASLEVYIFRGVESCRDAQTPRDIRVLQDKRVTPSGYGITTCSESNAGSIRRQSNVRNFKIISGWVISVANPPPFRMLKVSLYIGAAILQP